MLLLSLKINAILITAFINLLLGILVLLKNPKNRINFVFFLLSSLHGIWALCLFFYDFPLLSTNLFWIKATYFTVSIHEALVLIFSFIFPRSILNKTTAILSTVYISLYLVFSTWLLYFTDLWIIDVAQLPDKGLQTILGPGYTWWLFFIWGALIWALFNFIRNSRRSKGLARVQLQYLFYGFGLWGIAVNIPDVIIPLFWHDTRFFSIGAVSSLFFTGFIAFTILRHRFFDIRLVIARSVAYVLLILTLGVIYALGLLGAGYLFLGETASTTNLLASTMMALVIAFTFQPLRRFLESITNHIFYQDQYDTNELLQNISYIFATTPSVETMSKKALDLICLNLNTTHAAIVIPQHQGYDFISNRQNHEFHHLTKHDLQHLANNKKVIVYEEMREGKLKNILRTSHIGIAYPLIAKHKLIGILLLGHKASGEVFYQQDLKALDIIAPEFAIALQNSQQFDEITHFNITLKKKIDEATHDLRRANRELKHLDKLKDEFVFIATHELKTPVTVMKGYLSMLKDGTYGTVPDKIKPALAEIETANTQLIQLVTDLLEIARAEAKTLRIDTQPTEIFPIIKDIVKNLDSLAKDKGLKLAYQTLPSHHVEVFADPTRIKEIINNLISNAIKYSDHGTISISHESDGKNLITHVADEGVGLSEPDQKKIFQRFFRSENTASKPGTGLGLFIVKQIVEKMNGKIWFKSTLGKGSTFSFSLPLTKNSTAKSD